MSRFLTVYYLFVSALPGLTRPIEPAEKPQGVLALLLVLLTLLVDQQLAWLHCGRSCSSLYRVLAEARAALGLPTRRGTRPDDLAAELLEALERLALPTTEETTPA